MIPNRHLDMTEYELYHQIIFRTKQQIQLFWNKHALLFFKRFDCSFKAKQQQSKIEITEWEKCASNKRILCCPQYSFLNLYKRTIPLVTEQCNIPFQQCITIDRYRYHET